jgi:hypothetical protein
MEKVPSYANIFNKVRTGTGGGWAGLGWSSGTCVPLSSLSQQACVCWQVGSSHVRPGSSAITNFVLGVCTA